MYKKFDLHFIRLILDRTSEFSQFGDFKLSLSPLSRQKIGKTLSQSLSQFLIPLRPLTRNTLGVRTVD